MLEKKKMNVIFMLFSGLCIIAICICFLCNFVVNKSISWSLYVLLSVLYGWVILTPLLLAKKNKDFWILAAVTVLIIPYLFLMEKVLPSQVWFSALGLPCAIVAILSFWASYGVFKFLKINKWFKCSVLVFLFGVISNPIIEVVVARFTGNKIFTFDNILTFITMLLLSGLLFYIGRGHHLSEKFVVSQKSDTAEKAEKSDE